MERAIETPYPLPFNLYPLSISLAYHHNCWRAYLKSHEAELKAQPAPQIAINYYRDGDLYMFDEFQTTPGHEFREHVKTMVALQQPAAQKTLHSPHTIVELMPVCEDKSEILAPNLSYFKDNI